MHNIWKSLTTWSSTLKRFDMEWPCNIERVNLIGTRFRTNRVCHGRPPFFFYCKVGLIGTKGNLQVIKFSSRSSFFSSNPPPHSRKTTCTTPILEFQVRRYQKSNDTGLFGSWLRISCKIFDPKIFDPVLIWKIKIWVLKMVKIRLICKIEQNVEIVLWIADYEYCIRLSIQPWCGPKQPNEFSTLINFAHLGLKLRFLDPNQCWINNLMWAAQKIPSFWYAVWYLPIWSDKVDGYTRGPLPLE